MKRLLSICLTLALSVGVFTSAAVAAAGFGVSGVAGFALDGDTAMVNRSTTTSEAAVENLEGLLNEAWVPDQAPAAPVETGTLEVDLEGGGSLTFTILADSAGLYAKSGSKLLQIDRDDFHRLTNTFGYALYKYRTMPQLRIVNDGGSSSPVYVSKTSYAYKKLDNRFYKPFFEQNDLLQIVDPAVTSTLSFSVEPESVATKLVDSNGKEVYSGAWSGLLSYAKEKGGTYSGQVTATFRHDLYRGDITYAMEVGVDEPAGQIIDDSRAEAAFSIEGNSTYPGELMILRVHEAGENDRVTFSSDISFTPNFFTDGKGGKIALMPVSYFTGVGEHTISLSCNGQSVKWGISVKDKKFQIQDLVVDSDTTAATIDSQAANTEYENAIAPLRPVADSVQYWDGFVWPMTGRVTTEFGMIRYTNGRPTSSRHGAIDLAAPTGTPVKATANGRVLYAGFLKLTGNTVLIEHGYGLKSWYYHMNSLDVKAGDMVGMSQQIGTVGTTGFSTGPHLHFGMSVNNVFVNPNTIIDSDLMASTLE